MNIWIYNSNNSTYYYHNRFPHIKIIILTIVILNKLHFVLQQGATSIFSQI